ncbi:hypothetical protein [Paraburkholderia sp. MM5477-R1]|uniref:hypothetical protein n=1 Tax=Paraburkholderia sp. MM5477-R1 TaxID=2991062 RepID=UPI003D1CC6B3
MVAPTITQTDPAKIVYFDREVYGLKQRVFDCERISAQVTQEQCAASYLRNNIGSGCHSCSIGHHFSGGAPIAEDRHSAVNKSLGLSCIRCERSGHDAMRFVGRFRLTRKHTICVSCLNRELECVKGSNSKGAAPCKWAHLKHATITIENEAGEWQTLDIGLRAGRGECERYVARVHPGCSLVEVFIGGRAVQPSEVDPTPVEWYGAASRKARETVARKHKPKPLPVASDREAARNIDASFATAAKPVDWDDRETPLYARSAPSDESDADSSRQARRCGWLPPTSEEHDAAYRVSFNEPALDPESIAAFWDLTADGLPEFVEWLCEDWPAFKSTAEWEPSAADKAILNRGLSDHRVDCAVYGYPKRQQEAAKPPATAPDAVASPEVVDPAVSDSERTEPESEWAGCYLVRDGMTTYVCDYAKERGISDEEAAIVLGMCDPYYSDEPEPAAAPEPEPAPEPVKAEPAWQREKKLTKAEKKRLKKQECSARLHGNPQPAPNRMAAKQTAIAARAYALLQAGK